METELRKLYFETLEKEIKELINPTTGLLDEKYSKIINCPLCGALPSFHQLLFVKNGYKFVRCDQCEMIFTNPQVNENLLGELYGESKSNDLWVEIQKSEKEKKWKKEYFISHLELLKKYHQSSNARLLDIGCSTGFFLELAGIHQKNWDCKGLELNINAYEYAIERRLKVEKKFLSQLEPIEKFDIFTMFGVLEHLPNPINMLNDIKKYSKEDQSLLLIVVPNAYSLYHMFIQSKSLGFDGRNHLLYFSKKTLQKLLTNNGFEILHIDTVLTGLDNIKNQIQWLDPYSEIKTTRFIPEGVSELFANNEIEKFIFEHDLGLRLRVLARYKKV